MKSSLDTRIFLTEKYAASVAIVGCLHCPSSAHVRSRGKSDIFLPRKRSSNNKANAILHFLMLATRVFLVKRKKKKSLNREPSVQYEGVGQ